MDRPKKLTYVDFDGSQGRSRGRSNVAVGAKNVMTSVPTSMLLETGFTWFSFALLIR